MEVVVANDRILLMIYKAKDRLVSEVYCVSHGSRWQEVYILLPIDFLYSFYSQGCTHFRLTGFLVHFFELQENNNKVNPLKC